MSKIIYEFKYSEYSGKGHGARVNDDNKIFVWNGMYGEIEEGPIAISAETTEKIKNAIKTFPEIFTLERIYPKGLILDGSHETFFFCDGEKEVKINASNLNFCEGDDADKLISLHNEIAEILISQGFDITYFLLHSPIKFNEDDILDLDDAMMLAIERATIYNCIETKDAFIFATEPEDIAPSDNDAAFAILKKGGKVLPVQEYHMHKKEYDLFEEDDEVIAEHDIGTPLNY